VNIESRNTLHEDEDDVIVIEQRDKRALYYIAIALVIGIAAGGLVGASLKDSYWSKQYALLESDLNQTQQASLQAQKDIETKQATLETQVEARVIEEITRLEQAHQLEITNLTEVIEELDKLNESLESRLEIAQSQIAESETSQQKMNQQADMQVAMYQRSRELFQKEVKLRQEVERLTAENEANHPKLVQLKSDCDTYLEGKSWDIKSDVCDKQDAVNNLIHQNNQLIEVYKMDLAEIEAITEQLGLDN
jgi:chromosome segregation ATPase